MAGRRRIGTPIQRIWPMTVLAEQRIRMGPLPTGHPSAESTRFEMAWSVVTRWLVGKLLIALNDRLYKQLDPSILLPACRGAIAGAGLGFSPALDPDA